MSDSNNPLDASLSAFLPTWSHASSNPFIERYSGLPDAEWETKLLAAAGKPEQDGVSFPRMPPQELQQRIHGHDGETAIREAVRFYRAIGTLLQAEQGSIRPDTRLLDFGSGWGRIVRPFMARINLENIFGYEPNPLFCHTARLLNPYVAFVNGDYAPPTIFGNETFDLIVSWSVFTHLPLGLTKEWLLEFSRIMRPGGFLFITAWGDRFLDTLKEAAKLRQAGKATTWFQGRVLDSIDDLEALERRVKEGSVEFVPSKERKDWGNLFLSPRAAKKLSVRGLEQVAYDVNLVGQDLVVFRRS